MTPSVGHRFTLAQRLSKVASIEFIHYITGIRVGAAVVAGEGEGAAEDLPQGVADGELHAPQDEPQLFSHGEWC